MSTNFTAADMWVTGKDATKARLHRPTCKKVNTGLAHTVDEALTRATGLTVWVAEASAASCCKPPVQLVTKAISAAQTILDMPDTAPETDPAEVLEAIAALDVDHDGDYGLTQDDVDRLADPELDDESDPLAADEDPQTDYTAKAYYEASKAPRYFWRAMSKLVAPAVAEQFGVRAEVLSRSFTVVIHADSKDDAVEAADYLVALWRTCAIAVKTWRKTDEDYLALPEKGSKWSTSARFRAEEEHIALVARGTLDTI